MVKQVIEAGTPLIRLVLGARIEMVRKCLVGMPVIGRRGIEVLVLLVLRAK